MHGAWRAVVPAVLMLGAAATANPKESAGGAAAVPIEAASWAPVFPDQPQGPAMAVLWGDPKKGPVGFLLRFPAGAKVPSHVHSSDYRGIVISGEFSHAAAREPTVTLGPGSYWSQRGKLLHENACSPAGPCVVYLTAPHGFDLTFAR
ncbi:MAG TPA: cupin domain-containing protein [Myxococcaceae bacterium]|nr:cupin domain-containing protein [Myxococcaceae bacterium]